MTDKPAKKPSRRQTLRTWSAEQREARERKKIARLFERLDEAAARWEQRENSVTHAAQRHRVEARAVQVALDELADLREAGRRLN